LNVEGVVPAELPFQFVNGKCTYQIDDEHVHILNKSDEDDEGMHWSEPLAAYEGVRHWVIVEQTQEPVPATGFLRRLFGRRAIESPVEEGPRHAVIGLAHKKEAWMSVVLFSRELGEEEDGSATEKIAEKYRGLFSFS
jgi:hypothetical protein